MINAYGQLYVSNSMVKVVLCQVMSVEGAFGNGQVKLSRSGDILRWSDIHIHSSQLITGNPMEAVCNEPARARGVGQLNMEFDVWYFGVTGS